MKFKSLILIAGLSGFFVWPSSSPAVVVTFGDSACDIQTVYLEDCTAMDSSTEGFKNCPREVLDSLMNALCLNPAARICLTYETTLNGCDTAQMALTCLVNHGVPADRIVTLETPAADPESTGGFVEISLVTPQGPEYSMVK